MSSTPVSRTTHPKLNGPDASIVGLTLRQLHVVVVLGFCGLVSAADNWFVSPALPAIANTLAVAPTAAAIILTAYLVPYGALQPVCGRIGDGVGRLRLLRTIVLGLCAGTFLCALAPNLSLLVAARIITGCFAAGILSVSQAFVGDVVGPKHRAGAVGILMGITFTGQGLSAGLGGILTDLVGWRAAFAAFGHAFRKSAHESRLQQERVRMPNKSERRPQTVKMRPAKMPRAPLSDRQGRRVKRKRRASRRIGQNLPSKSAVESSTAARIRHTFSS